MNPSVYDISVKKIDGTPASLRDFEDQVVLVVNVASKCGLTKQYDGLEKLYETYRDKGLVVAGFPANDFGAQEPGSHEEIQEFCRTSFGVQFPLFEKITVIGPEKHPLYRALIEAQPTAQTTGEVPFRDQLKKYGMTPNPEPEVLWNFEKFLIDRHGMVVKRFAPDTSPEDPALVASIVAELGKD